MQKIVCTFICIFSSISCFATDPQKTYFLLQALLMGQISASIDKEQHHTGPIKDGKLLKTATSSKKHKKKKAVSKITPAKKNNIRN